MTEHIVWAVVSKEEPWSEWWPKLCLAHKWPADITVEKWSLSDFSWSRVIDSAKTFSLFTKFKAIVITDADKALKLEKDTDKVISALSKGPHKIVLQSESSLPKSLKINFWKSPSQEFEQADDKIAFRWIDSIHQALLSTALDQLEQALQQGQHPLALLQLLSRDFRLGRLIQYALEQRYRESEIVESLRVNPYAIKKWNARRGLKKSQWTCLFERLRRADLELKSGYDDTWALRKLTFDLVQVIKGEGLKAILPSQQLSSSSPLLWPVATSFA